MKGTKILGGALLAAALTAGQAVAADLWVHVKVDGDGGGVKVGGFAWYLYILLCLGGLFVAVVSVGALTQWNLWGLFGLIGGLAVAYFARRAAVRRQHP